MKKMLGKIIKAKFGFGGYQGIQFGIWFTFEGKGWSVCDGIGTWSCEITEHTKWTEKDRSKFFDEVMRKAMDLCKKAKVQSFDQLVGIPVEVTFINNSIHNWKILEEVL